jgi:MtN3 and saliva related transmembrane protein
MKFSFIDRNVSTTMNVFLVIANIINLFYNIPQMVTTYKRKSTKDFSTTFLVLRIVGNLIWIGYAIEVSSLLMLINNIVTVLSSVFISYYKALEIIADYKKKNDGFILPLDNIYNDNNDNNDNDNNNKINKDDLLIKIDDSEKIDDNTLYEIDIHNDDKNKLIN